MLAAYDRLIRPGPRALLTKIPYWARFGLWMSAGPNIDVAVRNEP
jgi:hypothetical protein